MAFNSLACYGSGGASLSLAVIQLIPLLLVNLWVLPPFVQCNVSKRNSIRSFLTFTTFSQLSRVKKHSALWLAASWALPGEKMWLSSVLAFSYPSLVPWSMSVSVPFTSSGQCHRGRALLSPVPHCNHSFLLSKISSSVCPSSQWNSVLHLDMGFWEESCAFYHREICHSYSKLYLFSWDLGFWISKSKCDVFVSSFLWCFNTLMSEQHRECPGAYLNEKNKKPFVWSIQIILLCRHTLNMSGFVCLGIFIYLCLCVWAYSYIHIYI